MKRFYVTSSPEQARHILLDTVEDAIVRATKEVQAGRYHRRFVVQVVAVVEEAPTPTQVVWLRENPDYEA
jgi:hypothetical protein